MSEKDRQHLHRVVSFVNRISIRAVDEHEHLLSVSLFRSTYPTNSCPLKTHQSSCIRCPPPTLSHSLSHTHKKAAATHTSCSNGSARVLQGVVVEEGGGELPDGGVHAVLYRQQAHGMPAPESPHTHTSHDSQATTLCCSPRRTCNEQVFVLYAMRVGAPRASFRQL